MHWLSALPAGPAFAGVPGGMELLVIGLIALLLFGVPAVLLVVVGARWFGRESRIEELEREVNRLRENVKEGRRDAERTPEDAGTDQTTRTDDTPRTDRPGDGRDRRTARDDDTGSDTDQSDTDQSDTNGSERY